MKLLLILSIAVCVMSCSETSDIEYMLMHIKDSTDGESFVYDEKQNSISRYDDLGFIIDKHWFDKDNSLMLYTMYNRFHNSDRARFRVSFNSSSEIKDVEGKPFYVSSDLFNGDTVLVDTIRTYIYMGESPFLKSRLKIVHQNITDGVIFPINVNQPNYVEYYEDYPKPTIKNTSYSFMFGIGRTDLIYSDTVTFKCYTGLP